MKKKKKKTKKVSKYLLLKFLPSMLSTKDYSLLFAIIKGVSPKKESKGMIGLDKGDKYDISLSFPWKFMLWDKGVVQVIMFG